MDFYCRSFLNINLQYFENGVDKKIILGMVPIYGSATALNIKKLFEARLMEFGLNPKKHIVATSGDGVSAMASFGSMIASEYLQCSDHGIYLGVTKVLYLKKQSADAPVDDDNDIFFVECGNENKPDKDVPDAGEDTESDNEEEANSLQMVFAYQSTITKLRKIVSLFHRSLVKNEILQKFVKRINNGRELKLKLDSKTRWGSLHDACERFLKLLGPVKEALNHREIDKTYLWADIDSKRLGAGRSSKSKGGAGRSSESSEVGNSILVKEISKSHRLQHNYQVSLGQFRNV
nr:uncharacterized protein LOC124807157 [Hydra vulgaris]